MTNTPETDANQIFLGFNPDEGDYFVPAEITRKLEQQRDETRETAERYRLEANAMMMQRDRLAEVLNDLWHNYSLTGAAYELIEQALAAVKGGSDDN